VVQYSVFFCSTENYGKNMVDFYPTREMTDSIEAMRKGKIMQTNVSYQHRKVGSKSISHLSRGKITKWTR